MVIGENLDAGDLCGELVQRVLAGISDGDQGRAFDLPGGMIGVHLPHAPQTDHTNAYFCHNIKAPFLM